VRAVITALATESKAKVLASPHILVSDNREARIQVGQQVPLSTSTTTTPIVGGTTTVTNTSTSTIQYKDIGIILKVKPQINDSGLITLELGQEVSSLGDNVVIADQAFASINKEEVTTNLVAQDGETIIIGGLIREDTNKSKNGIPFLSKIPILGNLFGNTSDNVSRNEIIVLLTPHVMRNLKEAEKVTSDYLERYQGTSGKEVGEFIKEKGGDGGSAGTKNPR
jgi:general secretion pathway protein D